MSIIHKETFYLWKENNNDVYGKCIMNVAEEAMRILDENNTPLEQGYYPNLNTPHGIICQADDNINAGGITGFMASAVEKIVISCHTRGKEFKNNL